MIKASTLGLVTLAITSLLAAAATPSPSAKTTGPSTATRQTCATTGATWTWGKKKGNRYRVYPAGTTCSFAKRWSERLSHKRPVVSGLRRTIRGGPAGWACYIRFPVPFPRAWAGTCSKGRRGFAWLPLLPRATYGP
jgi:hypothetical protein